jgi:hypothetical protein
MDKLGGKAERSATEETGRERSGPLHIGGEWSAQPDKPTTRRQIVKRKLMAVCFL